jgi:hypothetical protein
MILTLDYIKKLMGWCPKMDTIKTPAHEYKEGYENAGNGVRASRSEPSQDPHSTARRDHPGYQENTPLILLALVWLLPIVYQRDFFPIMFILSAAALYYDAKNIRAGSKFEKETLLGNIVTWRPISWGAVTFAGGIIAGGIVIMAIYLFHRREIYNANN